MMAESSINDDYHLFFRDTKRQIIFGYAVLALFIGLLVMWSVFIPLSSAAIAPGQVSVEGYSKTIEHLEGGIIEKILVKDGDKVIINQTLIELDGTQIKADFESINSQLILTAARYSRLQAEKNEQKLIIIPEWLNNVDNLYEVERLVKEQEQTFEIRRTEFFQQMSFLDNRITKFKNQVDRLKNSLFSQKKLLAIVRAELKQHANFLQKGLVTRKDFFKLQNNEATIEIEIQEKKSDLSSIRQQISQLRQQKMQLTAERHEQVNQQLQIDQETLVKLRQRHSQLKDMLSRVTIKAPVSGTIVGLQKNTIGGVIEPGEMILQIVPTGRKLLVEAHVQLKDRDIVNIGQDAEVRLTAFNQRVLRPIKGKVTGISADSLLDQTTLIPYYSTTVELLEDPAVVLNDTPVHPGMQASVMILTGERTAMEYLTKPLLSSFTNAFREE